MSNIEIIYIFSSVQFSRSVVSNSRDSMNRSMPGSLSITNSRSSLKLTSIESVILSSHLILCCPLLLLPPIPPSIRVFSNESTLRMRWQKYWSFSFSIGPSNEHWSPLGWTGWIFLQSKGLSRVFSNTTVQKHQFFGAQLSSHPALTSIQKCTYDHTIALILHASKVMLKILQVWLQQYVNCELPDFQAGFRKGRGTWDQIANIRRIMEKTRVPEKHLFLLYWLCQSLWLCGLQ